MTLTSEAITQGTMRTADGRILPLSRTDVRSRISGPIATVEVKQLFQNPASEPIEAVYSFPLPPEASVYRMEFHIADRVVRATVKEKEQAKRDYERARREGRSATLLEQAHPSLFTLSVANVPAGASIEVLLEYQEVLGYDAGEWRFVFPMVAPERYRELPEEHAARMPRGSGKGQVRPPRLPTGERSGDISLEVEVRSTGVIEDLRSTTHRVETSPLPDGGCKVQLHGSESIPNRDFVLTYRAGSTGVRPEAHFEREAGKTGSFLLVLTPPVEQAEPDAAGGKGALKAMQCGNCGAPVTDMSAIREIAGFGPAVPCTFCGAILAPTTEKITRATRSRDVAIIVDRSASMRGSLAQARKAVRALLEGLLPGDAVQVIAFDHDRIAFDDEGSRFVALAPEVISRIDRFLEGIKPRGGSELEVALERVAKLQVRADRTQAVVLITDAAVGNEGRLLRRIPEILGTERRLFVLGLGPAVDRRLVERFARACGGASDVLSPQEDITSTMERFTRRVRDGGPLLTGLSVSWEGAGISFMYPSSIPDLFGGEPVKLLGRYEGSGPSRLVITGATADNRPFRQEVTFELPAESSETPGLARLWAKRRADACMDLISKEPGQAEKLRGEVLSLGLAHALVTPLTSLVAEDSEIVGKGAPKRIEVPTLMPAPDDSEKDDFDSTVTLDFFEAPAMAADEAPIGRMMSFEGECAMPSLDGDFRECGIAGAGSFDIPMAESMPMAEMSFEASPEPFTMKPPPPPPPPPASPSPMRVDESMRSAPRAYRKSESRAGGLFAARVEEHLDAPARSARKMAPPAQTSQIPIEAPGSEQYEPEELRWLSKRATGELDMVFLVDETGSMGPYIQEVKQRLIELVAALQKAPLCRSLRIGLVTYRDHPPQDYSYASKVVPLTEDIGEIERAVQVMQADGGGDGPESVTDGLFDMVRLDWRPRAARAVVWFGDAPPHGVEPGGDGFPDGCPCGNHWYTQAENCREMGISVYAVGCLPTLRHYVGAEEVFRTVARVTRANYLPLGQASLLIPIMLGAAATELDKQRIDERLADVVTAHADILADTDEPERVRFLTDLMRAEGVRPRSMDYDPESPAPAPLRFREIQAGDIEASLDRLRIAGRATFEHQVIH